MTEKRRIALNTLATYGRSLYALALGLVCGRWALMSLGESDYGLFGLIGGMAGFVSFLNVILAAAVGRFYAVKVGEARRFDDLEAGVDECRKWFNTALEVHTVVPIALVAVGYPAGLWMVKSFLVIPADRMADCIWVWRFTCVTCFVGMATVPFQAMYTAKQEIAELTVYSFAATTFNAVFLYYMITHPGRWLVGYSGWMCAIAVVPQLAIAVRAVAKYPECRVRRRHLLGVSRYKELLVFAAAQFWSNFSSVFSSQGQSILVNKYMGAAYNASMTIGNTVASQALTLSSSLDGAFWPAITNKTGEGDAKGVERLCFMSMRLGTVLVLVFAVPLALEMAEVLRLWLVNPPDFAAEIALVILARSVLERMTCAYSTAIYGYGRGIVRYSWTVGWAGISTVAVAWASFALGFGMWSIIAGLSVSKIITVSVRLYLGRTLVGFRAGDWVRRVFSPIALAMVVSTAAGMLPRTLMDASFLRIVMTSAVCEIVLLPICWMCVLDNDEREFIKKRISRATRGSGGLRGANSKS